MNWEECDTLTLIPKKTTQKIYPVASDRLTPTAASAEEQVFFKSFQEELAKTTFESRFRAEIDLGRYVSLAAETRLGAYEILQPVGDLE